MGRGTHDATSVQCVHQTERPVSYCIAMPIMLLLPYS